MNVLVTGGSGFIGSHVVDKLMQAGHQVRVLDQKKPCQKDVEFIKGDVTSELDIAKSLRNIDVVYHIAAFSNIDLVRDHPLSTIEVNIMGTARILEKCRGSGVQRFIYASSVFVSDTRGHLYTTSKLASEMICKNYNTLYGLPCTILRYGTAYGPRSRRADVVSIFAERALQHKKLTIRGNGEQKRHFIYVEDLARGNLAALGVTHACRTYILADTQPITINELAAIVQEETGNDVGIRHQNARNDDYLGDVSGVETSKRELDWKPEVGIREGIRKYLGWYIETSR